MVLYFNMKDKILDILAYTIIFAVTGAWWYFVIKMIIETIKLK